jgi:ubiquinone/menaquinone biosynthesis C-methylase UbiE
MISSNLNIIYPISLSNSLKEKNIIFAGDLDKLQSHWMDEARAKKFLKGGTRTPAVKHILNYVFELIKESSWIDIATGAGFIQSQVDPSIQPTLFVGLDLSEAMLRVQEDPYGERVIASLFRLPFRNCSYNLVSNFFCLSDYPEIEEVMIEFARICDIGGYVLHADYGEGDGYWVLRKSLHNQIIEGMKIIGNINLRTLEDIKSSLPASLELDHSSIIEYSIDASNLKPVVQTETITRRIIFTIAKKI